jgi:O-antigen/teichoic acid export membrane protein
MNAAVLIVNANSGRALAGFVFNVLLIVRAPLQLFQAIQTSILPHLTAMEAREHSDEFERAIRITISAIGAFAGAVALGLLAIGPFVMTAFLGNKGFHYGRLGLAVVGIGMGLHLTAGTLNQAALARGQARLAAVAWLIAAALFVVCVATPTISAEVTRVEVAYATSALVLCGLLYAVYRRAGSRAYYSPVPASLSSS